MIKFLIQLWKDFWATPTIPIPEVIKPMTPQPVPPKYLWDNPVNAEHSVHLICDELGLTYDMQYGVASTKKILIACLKLESGFDNEAIHRNLNLDRSLASTDYYITQCNDHWHIGPGKDFPSVQYVHDNPEEMVRWMCKLFMNGKASLWSSFKFNGYKRYL